VWQAGLAAAEQAGDPAARARAHRLLGLAYARVGRHTEAVRHLQRALTLAGHTGDTLAQATPTTLSRGPTNDGARTSARWNTPPMPSVSTRHSPCRCEKPRHSTLLAGTTPCWVATSKPVPTVRTALNLHRHHDDEPATLDSLGYTLDSLGYIAHHSGRHLQARDYYLRALAVFRDPRQHLRRSQHPGQAG